MATVIDELTVELGFDTKKLQTGRADAKAQADGLKNDLSKIDDDIAAIRKRSVEKTTAEDQKRLKSLAVLRQERKKALDEAVAEGKKEDEVRKKQADGFRTVSREAAGFVATLAGFDAIKTLFTNTVQADRALGNLSKNLGVSAQALSAWRTVSKEINGPSGAADVDAGMQMLVKTGQDFKNGIMDPNVKWLQRLGITSVDQMLDPVAGFAAITNHMQGMSQKDRQFYGQQAGLSEGMVNVLGRDPGDLNAKLTEAKKLAPTDADIKRGQDYAATLSLMGDSWGKLGQTVVVDVGPPLTALATGITDLIEKSPKLTARILEIVTALGMLRTAAGILNIFGIALPAGTGSAVGGAVSGAVSGAAGAAAISGGAALAAGAGGLALNMVPTDANKGEMDILAKNRMQTLYAKLVGAGIPSQQALGIVAGGFAESGLNARAVNPKSGAFGIEQLLGARLRRLKDKYGVDKKTGLPLANFDQQADFLISELKGGDAGGASVLGSGSAADAASNYITKFMRPAKGNETTGDFKRANAALAAMGQSVINNTTSTVTVQQLTINTKATDAKGIAGGINDALASYSYTGQANTGQQ
jgi:hypothetical protein